nr:hypothetical protein GCM10010200_045510 [Actinomadura rugatobispora]
MRRMLASEDPLTFHALLQETFGLLGDLVASEDCAGVALGLEKTIHERRVCPVNGVTRYC